MHYYDSNGLVDGEVPAGKPCPYLDACGLRNDNCPSEERGNLRMEHGFSCACARAISLMLDGAKKKGTELSGVHPVLCMICKESYRYTSVQGSTGLCTPCLNASLAKEAPLA